MNEQACHLVDRVLPRAPYRQWVLTLPRDLARVVAYDAKLCSRVFGVFAEQLGRWHRQRAVLKGVDAPHAGSVMEIQRFADAAMLWSHAHLLAPDGVFYETREGGVRFHGIGPPRDEDVRLVLARTITRVGRVLERRRQLAENLGHDEVGPDDSLLLEVGSTAPAESVRVAEAERDVGSRRRPQATQRRKKRCVRSSEGFELHANVHVAAHDRAGLERLCP